MKAIVQKIKELKISNIFPFLGTLRHYNFKRFRVDIVAALTVAIIAVPQSMAYAIIAGVHPKYGLYAAIVPVIISSLFGSSRFLISGPTNAVSMVLFSAISTTAIGGTLIVNMPDDQKIAMVFLLSFLVGVIQVAMGLGKFGKLINFVSHSVIVGFSAGAGVLIGFNQLKNFLGLNIKSYPHFTETITSVAKHITETNLPSLGIGIFTILFIIIAKKISPKIPSLFLAMVFSGIIAFFYKLNLFGVKLIGEISRSLPPISGFHFDADLVKILFMPALAISILAIVEALSIAKSLANSNGEKINGNQELIAQGLGNISASFFSGIPGTGSFTRSAVNFKSGASSRFAGVFSGILVLSTIIIFAPLAKFIPLASLAGILMVIAYQMVNKKALLFSFRATKRDRIVLVSTILATIFLELEMAIYIGVFLSIALHIRKASRPQFYEVVPRLEDNKLISIKKGERYCPQLSIFQIEGSLFFASAEAIEEKLYSQANKSIIILRMKQVRFVDASGAHAIDMFIDDCKKKDIKVIFSGLRPNVMGVFKNSGLFEKVGEKNFTDDTKTAIKIAFDNYIKRDACKSCNQIIYSECKN